MMMKKMVVAVHMRYFIICNFKPSNLCQILVILLFSSIYTSAMDASCVTPENNEEYKCGALVPYENSHEHFLSRFYEKERAFTIGKFTLKVKQNWDKLGVAGVVWDAAVVLGEYLSNDPNLVENKNVIELGAGTGILGIIASYLGSNVVITDLPSSIPHIKKVVKANVDSTKSISIKPLDWTDDIKSEPYDIILGADIIYIEDIFKDLIRTLLALSNKQTIIYLSCKIRYERDERFLRLLKEHFAIEDILHDKDRDIRIFKATFIGQ